MYRNAAQGFIGELSVLLERGREIGVRGHVTKELLSRQVQLRHPRERCITLPARRNDVFATVAETMWVLGGRQDLAYLTEYLPRAVDFSDDGSTWRAAYGPRLRSWHGTDQLREVQNLLRADPSTRRAVMSIFDPAADYIETKDVPCNNWLQFIGRDGALAMNVVVRSNDLVWGFSGINTFEWSVLHEIMANSVGLEMGTVTYFVGSLHLYERHFGRGQEILRGFDGHTGYESGWRPVRCTTTVDTLDEMLERWFELENTVRTRTADEDELQSFPDPLFRAFIWMLHLRAEQRAGAGAAELERKLSVLGHTDMALAAGTRLLGPDWLARQRAATVGDDTTADDLGEFVRHLHRMKSDAYGDSWKRRGELLGILPNIARKVDRIAHVAAGAPAADESLFDTAVDLYVYCIKYLTFLADRHPAVRAELFPTTEPPFSDGVAGFEDLAPRLPIPDHSSDRLTVPELAATITGLFDQVTAAVENAPPAREPHTELPRLRELTLAAHRLLRRTHAGEALVS